MSLRLSILLALSLCGCARFEPKPISSADNAARLESRTLASEELKPFLEKNLQRESVPWPPDSWDFDMLTLAALYYHPSLEVARAEWSVARAGVITAGARPNPTLSAVPQYAVNSPGGVSHWLATISFDIPIETAGKRSYRLDRAQHLSEAARLNLATAAWRVRSHLREALLEQTALQQRAERLQQQAEILQQLVRLYDERVKAGVLTPSESLPVRFSFQKNAAELAAVRQAVAENRAKVAEAIGVPLAALATAKLGMELASTPRRFPDDQVAQLRREALQSRPDILSALAEYAAAQAALQLEIAKQYPDVHLGPGYEYDQGQNKWALGFSVELPLLNRNQGPIAEAQAKREAAAAHFNAIQAGAIAEIDRALAAHHASQEQLQSLDSLFTTQQQQAESVQARLNAGGADRVELLSAQVELTTAQLDRLHALFRMQQTLGQLEDALQNPLSVIPSTALEPRQAHAADRKP